MMFGFHQYRYESVFRLKPKSSYWIFHRECQTVIFGGVNCVMCELHVFLWDSTQTDSNLLYSRQTWNKYSTWAKLIIQNGENLLIAPFIYIYIYIHVFSYVSVTRTSILACDYTSHNKYDWLAIFLTFLLSRVCVRQMKFQIKDFITIIFFGFYAGSATTVSSTYANFSNLNFTFYHTYIKKSRDLHGDIYSNRLLTLFHNVSIWHLFI